LHSGHVPPRPFLSVQHDCNTDQPICSRHVPIESAPSPVPIAVPILFLRLSAGPCDNPAGESTRDFIHDRN
jgi:hypothetical protein